MRYSVHKKSPGIIRGALAAITLAAFGLMALPHHAAAALMGTAGNAIIRNAGQVAYSDAAGQPQQPAPFSIDVKVNTIPASPSVLSFFPASGTTDGAGATQAYTVTIRTNSNGPGTITLSAADSSETNLTLSATGPSIPATVFLGATIIDPSDTKIGIAQNIANGATITFNAPNDGGGPSDAAVTGGGFSDGVLNGLKSSDTVYLTDGTTYYGPFTVGTVVDPAVGTGVPAAGSIPLTNASGAALAFTPAAGWMIVETKPATLTVTQGLVGNPTLAASWVTTVTGDMNGWPGTGNVTTNASGGLLTVIKYSRNVTTSAAGSGLQAFAINGGANYYSGGVAGKPTDVIEYLVHVHNSGTGAAKAVTATDTVPTYTTLVTGASYGSGSGNVFAIARSNDNSEISLTTVDGVTESAAIASGKVVGTALTFYLGDTNTYLVGGTMATGQNWYVTYRVTIN